MRKGMFCAMAAAATVSTLRVICGSWVTALEGAFLLFWVLIGMADIYIWLDRARRKYGRPKR